MGLLTLIPGDNAIHTPTQTRVHILSYADCNFTAVGLDDENNLITTLRIVGPVTDFVPPISRDAEKPADPKPPTAAEIARLQEQITDLQKKLQQVEAERDAAAERAVALIAEASATPPQPQTRIEVRVERNIGSYEMALLLNEGWGILHMQFMPAPAGYEDTADEHLNVVLQREVPVPPPPQPEARAAAPQPAPVRTVTGTVVQPEPAPAPAEPADVYASILRRHDLPISERLALMDKHIFEEVGARHAARVQQYQSFQPRPLITTGVQS